jgi:hypothetical protein
MATTIIPAGETRPVRIPKMSQITIDEYPRGTKGKVELDYAAHPEVIYYPLQANPHPVLYNIPDEICNIKNTSKTINSFICISDVPYTLPATML